MTHLGFINKAARRKRVEEKERERERDGISEDVVPWDSKFANGVFGSPIATPKSTLLPAVIT